MLQPVINTTNNFAEVAYTEIYEFYYYLQDFECRLMEIIVISAQICLSVCMMDHISQFG